MLRGSRRVCREYVTGVMIVMVLVLVLVQSRVRVLPKMAGSAGDVKLPTKIIYSYSLTRRCGACAHGGSQRFHRLFDLIQQQQHITNKRANHPTILLPMPLDLALVSS